MEKSFSGHPTDVMTGINVTYDESSGEFQVNVKPEMDRADLEERIAALEEAVKQIAENQEQIVNETSGSLRQLAGQTQEAINKLARQIQILSGNVSANATARLKAEEIEGDE